MQKPMAAMFHIKIIEIIFLKIYVINQETNLIVYLHFHEKLLPGCTIYFTLIYFMKADKTVKNSEEKNNLTRRNYLERLTLLLSSSPLGFVYAWSAYAHMSL